jgi:hypothetical protein
MEETRNTIRILVRNIFGRWPLGGLMRRWEDNTV